MAVVGKECEYVVKEEQEQSLFCCLLLVVPHSLPCAVNVMVIPNWLIGQTELSSRNKEMMNVISGK